MIKRVVVVASTFEQEVDYWPLATIGAFEEPVAVVVARTAEIAGGEGEGAEFVLGVDDGTEIDFSVI